MKKARLMLAAAAAGILLAGCSAGGAGSFSPDRSCVYITSDGDIKSALVLETEETFEADADELREFLESAVERFNEKTGGSEGEEVPVSLDSCSVQDGEMPAVFGYRSAADLIAFRQSDENEDTSNSFTSIEVKSAADAGTAGWLAGEFQTADGKAVSGLDITKEQKALAVNVQGGGVLETEGQVLYMSNGVETISDTAVTVPEGQTSVVVFTTK